MQKLQTVNAETLLYEPLEKPSFVVDSLIPTGLSLFCGSQKIGKSWLMLKLCLCVSQAYYSLDCDNGIENAILMKPQTPEMLLEEKQLREQLYAAVMALPEKQAKRIYARYYLGMRVSEIAAAEGVDPSRIRDSIRRGLKQLAKYF